MEQTLALGEEIDHGWISFVSKPRLFAECRLVEIFDQDEARKIRREIDGDVGLIDAMIKYRNKMQQLINEASLIN